MQKCCLILMLILPLMAWAQGMPQTIPGDPGMEDEYADHEGFGYGMTGMVGSISMDGESYSQVRLRPEMAIGKFGFGLDIDMLFDANGKIVSDNWQDWRDYLNKIYFIRFAGRQDPFYFKVGCIPSYTLGHGLIFDHYSNVLRYPSEKNVGGYVGVNTPFSGTGLEIFTHNIHRNEILAARLHADPFHYTKVPFLQSIKLGVNIGTDRNQHSKYPDRDGDGIPDVYDGFPDDPNFWLDTDGDGIPDEQDVDIDGDGLVDHPDLNDYVADTFPNITDGADPDDFDYSVISDRAVAYNRWKNIKVFSIDYQIPIVESFVFSLDHYGEYAKIQKYGDGIIFPGFSTRFAIFNAKFEFRSFSDQFLPGYFDRLYDEQRSKIRITQSGEQRVYDLVTKEQFLKEAKSSLGWFAYLSANVLDIGYIKVAYQDMYGKEMNTGKGLWANITANPHNVLNLKQAGISYSQTHVPYVDFLNPRNANAAVSGQIVYSLSPNADLIGRYSEIYNDVNQDGKIKGDAEVISSFAFGVEFIF